jgi:hypothetical protein
MEVVYIHLTPTPTLDADYLYRNLCSTAQHGNNQVTLLTNAVDWIVPKGFPTTVRFVNTAALETRELTAFRRLYETARFRSLSEPWERQNTERFFYLHAYMHRQKLRTVMYLDSDVTLLVPASTSLLPRSDCGMLASIVPQMAKSAHWTVWLGTGLLKENVLRHFIHFVPQLFTSHRRTLAFKDERKPYIMDMTHWCVQPGCTPLRRSGAHLVLPHSQVPFRRRG